MTILFETKAVLCFLLLGYCLQQMKAVSKVSIVLYGEQAMHL